MTRRALRPARRVELRSAPPNPSHHVGYYLIGPGKAEFQAELGYRPGIGERLLDAVLRYPRLVYFGSIGGFSLALLALLVVASVVVSMSETVSPPLLVLLVLAALLPVSELAVGLVNYLLTLVLTPRTLPKLEFKEGIPEDLRHVRCHAQYAHPSRERGRLTERLEIHYLANPDAQMRFALLTEFADAPAENQPEDEGYVRDTPWSASRRSTGATLPRDRRRFFLFHRQRRWNSSEGCWMGWERKRGKLEEFNRLLRGDPDTSYTPCEAANWTPAAYSLRHHARCRYAIAARDALAGSWARWPIH